MPNIRPQKGPCQQGNHDGKPPQFECCIMALENHLEEAHHEG
jgi:hypothetical protein